MQLKRPTQHASNRRQAFSLTELMIAIALSLILILGINAVFKLSSDSIGTGFQVMQMTRQFRLVGNTMNNDMNNMADYETSPALIIQSLNTPAFRDKTDMMSEPKFTTGTITTDPSGGTFPTGMLQITTPTGGQLYPLTPAASYPAWTSITQASLYKVRYEIADDRNHRTDMLSFFAKDQYRRQTQPSLGGTAFESDFSCSEAWISYGHVILPNNLTNVPAIQTWYSTYPSSPMYSLGLSATTATNNDPSNPSATHPAGNPNNFYASQWILGRTAMLMSDPTSLSTYPNPYSTASPKTQEPQNYFVDTANVTGQPITPTLAAPLPPLGCTSQTNDSSMSPAYSPAPYIYYGLCDLAGASMGTFRNTVLTAEYQAVGTPTDLWYLPLVANPYTALQAPPGPDNAYRFLAKPWPNKTAAGLTAMQTTMGQEIARTMPVFGRGCSQFIVEYAGDYLMQDTTAGSTTYGQVKDIGEDGQLDFDVIPNSVAGQPPYKRIRWYGLTRSLDNGVTVEDVTQPIAANPPAAGDTEIIRPLYRYIQQVAAPTAGTFTHLPFEKIGISGFPQNASPTAYQTGYTCAWAPDDMHLDETQRASGDPYHNLISATPTTNGGKPYFPSRSMLPWLIRVTVRLDDPNGRVPQGQQMEFIFKVNRPH